MLFSAGNKPRYFFQVSGLPDDLFQAVRFRGVEEISQPFRFEIDLVSTVPDVDFAEVVNQPAHLTMLRGQEPTYVKGLVAHFEQANRWPAAVVYRVVLVPRVWRLTLNHQSRIYQNMSVKDIVEEVLRDAGFSSGGAAADYRFDLSGSYPTREYTVQYQETDFNFVCRLLEREGIAYYFDHDGDRDVFVMTDHRGRHKMIGGESALPYHVPEGLVPEREQIFDVVCREQLVPGKVVLKDYNYRTPETTLQVESQLNSRMQGLHYEYGDHFADAGQGRQLARVRNEELEARRREVVGKSTCVALRSGYVFEMEEHYRADLNDDYLLVRIEHEGTQQQAMGLEGAVRDFDDDRESYLNRFVAVPADTQYRPPRRTPVPRVPGIMTARIETAGGDYAYIDDHGRYRAKMHFDLGDAGEGTATRPIRMNQPYSGPNYGIHFPNHADTEVVWACVGGDVDRPIALGTVPNPSNASPSTAPNKMQNIIRTAAGNQMIMDDTKEETQVLINTKDLHRVLLDDKDDRIIVETTNKHKMTFDDKNKLIEVKTTDGHFILMDDENKKITVQSKDGHRISINDKDKLMTIVDESGENTFEIDIGNKKLTIKTENGDIDIHAPNGHIDIKSKTLTTTTTGDTKMKAANIESKADMDHKMDASNITQKASMNLSSEAGMEHKSKGLNVTSEAGLKQDVKGTMVTVQASGINTIQGSLVKIN